MTGRPTKLYDEIKRDKKRIKLIVFTSTLLILMLFSVLITQAVEEVPKDNSEEENINSETSEENVIQTNTFIKRYGLEDNENVQDDVEIKNIELNKNSVPKEIIDSAESYLISSNIIDDADNNVIFNKAIIYNDLNSVEDKYWIVYSYEIEYKRENGKSATSRYYIYLDIDQEGNILDETSPQERFNFIKSRGT